MVTRTVNYNLELVDFDTTPWHEREHNNWRTIDAVFSNFITVQNMQGQWENSLAVAVGARYVDGDLGTIWTVLIAHTTPSTGTFAADRLTNADRWESFSVSITSQGTWVTATTYTPNDFVLDAGRYGVVQSNYTSGATYDIDVANGDIVTLIDVSSVIAATHDTNTIATGGTPTATYNASTKKFDFGLVTGATGATGPLASVAGDTTPQLGGFLDANSKFVSLSQGASIASVAGDTDIWTNFDGNTVHITGTNAITDFGTPKSAGDFMWVIFDGAASVVDSATITVSGNTNYQAAANDIALVYALTTSTFLFTPFPNSGGSPVAASGGAWTLIGTQVADDSASTLTQTGLDSTYDTYAIAISDWTGPDDNNCLFRVGDSSGIDSGSGNYAQHLMYVKAGDANYGASESTSLNHIDIFRNPGGDAGEGAGAMIFLHGPGDAGARPYISGLATYHRSSDVMVGSSIFGERTAAITLDRVQIYISGANIATGRMTTWGIKHT